MDVPDRIRKLLPEILPFEAVKELIVLVNMTRDDVEIESRGGRRGAGK
jgi:hypothetical protein